MNINNLFLAVKTIEQDGIDGMELAEKLVGKQIALALLTTHVRRDLGSTDTFPSNPEIDSKVQEFLYSNRLLEIKSFQGEYRWLSNFWLHPITVFGYECKSVEHGYQAMSTFDEATRQKILSFSTAAEAKEERKREGFSLRKDWAEKKLSVMRSLIAEKFSMETNHELAYKLYLTRPYKIIEGNTWGDNYWGEFNGQGANNLGQLHMERRSYISKILNAIKIREKPKFLSGGRLHDYIDKKLCDIHLSFESKIKWLQIIGFTY